MLSRIAAIPVMPVKIKFGKKIKLEIKRKTNSQEKRERIKKEKNHCGIQDMFGTAHLHNLHS